MRRQVSLVLGTSGGRRVAVRVGVFPRLEKLFGLLGEGLGGGKRVSQAAPRRVAKGVEGP